MTRTIRIFQKDLLETLSTLRGIILVFVLPAIILLFVGRLRVGSPELRMVVAGRPAAADSAVLNRLLALLDEVSHLQVSRRSRSTLDPLATLGHGRYDLLLDLGDARAGGWRLYTAETEERRIRLAEAVAMGIERTVIELRAQQQDTARAARTTRHVADELTSLGALGSTSLVSYYPQASDRRITLIPTAISLILCLLPFVLALTSLIREKEDHTVEILLAAPGQSLTTVFAGKCMLPIMVGGVELLLLLTLTQAAYGINIKSGILELGVLVTLVLLASTLLGLAVSAVATSQAQALIAASLYFLMLVVFSGFASPVDESSRLVRAVSTLFPLTFLHPALTSWLFGVGNVHDLPRTLAAVGAQCLLFGGLAVFAYRRMLRRI
jgi:ABC-type multidrug transport system permease subunit